MRSSHRDGEEYLTGRREKPTTWYATHAVQGEQDFTGKGKKRTFEAIARPSWLLLAFVRRVGSCAVASPRAIRFQHRELQLGVGFGVASGFRQFLLLFFSCWSFFSRCLLRGCLLRGGCFLRRCLLSLRNLGLLRCGCFLGQINSLFRGFSFFARRWGLVVRQIDCHGIWRGRIWLDLRRFLGSPPEETADVVRHRGGTENTRACLGERTVMQTSARPSSDAETVVCQVLNMLEYFNEFWPKVCQRAPMFFPSLSPPTFTSPLYQQSPCAFLVPPPLYSTTSSYPCRSSRPPLLFCSPAQQALLRRLIP